MYTRRSLIFTFLVALLLINIECVTTKTQKIKSGKIYFSIKHSPSSSPELFQFAYDSSIKSEIKLTQSSTVEAEAKLKFTSESFRPQLISFRLRHEKFDHLTEPVQLLYDSQSQSFKAIIDFGDPKTIKPFSDNYKLELIIADEALENNVRRDVANFKINFRYSMSENEIPNANSAIHYATQKIIQNPPPETRIDPPQTFTTFILIVMSLYCVFFCWGLSYLKVNFKQLPTNGMGLLSNLALIILVAINLVFLIKFWLSWNFLTTANNFFWLIIITALVANTALQYVKIAEPINKSQ